MHADRTNRTIMILLSLVLIAGGGVILALSFGAFGAASADATLFKNRVGAFVDDNSAWFWPVVAVICLVILLLVVRWLVAVVFSTDRSGDVVLPGDRMHGTTTLAAGALTAAAEREVESFTGVHSASARLIGDPTAPELVLEVSLNRDADLTAVRRRIESETIGNVRQAMDQPDMPASIDLSVSNRTIDAVR